MVENNEAADAEAQVAKQIAQNPSAQQPAPAAAAVPAAPPVPVVPDPNSILAQANATAERLENANKVMAANLAKQEALQVQQTLGGSADASVPGKTAEQKSKDSANKYLEGTGMEIE